MQRFQPQPRGVFSRWRSSSFVLAIAGSLLIGLARLHAADVAVFFALDADLKTLAASAKPLGQPVKIGDRTAQRLELGGHRVYAVKMGSGAVETAISAAGLLARFRCDLAFSLGPVGALDDALTVGSWHEVTQTVPYQHGSWGTTGFQSAASAATKVDTPRQIWADRLQLPSLLAAASKITVASGELFITSSSYRTQLQASTGAQAVDMNLFGLQSACESHQVPLFSWRIVSDRADDQAGEMFRAFVKGYDGAGGRAIAEVVRHLPVDPNSVEAYPALKSLLGAPTPSSVLPKSHAGVRPTPNP